MFQGHWERMHIFYRKQKFDTYRLYSLYYLNPNSLSASYLYEDWGLKIKLWLCSLFLLIFLTALVWLILTLCCLPARPKHSLKSTCSLGLVLVLLGEPMRPLPQRQAPGQPAGWGDTRGSVSIVAPVCPACSQSTPAAERNSRSQILSELSWDPQQSCPVEPNPNCQPAE